MLPSPPRAKSTTSRRGRADRVPTDPVSVAVALADKIDTLVGFWAIDEKPTGSKDPYALRRAALGVIRLIVEYDASILNLYAARSFFDELRISKKVVRSWIERLIL